MLYCTDCAVTNDFPQYTFATRLVAPCECCKAVERCFDVPATQVESYQAAIRGRYVCRRPSS